LKTGLAAGADFLIGDASQWRDTRLCGPLLSPETRLAGLMMASFSKKRGRSKSKKGEIYFACLDPTVANRACSAPSFDVKPDHRLRMQN
jgi:hypothetical protein